MEKIEKQRPFEHDLLLPFDGETSSPTQGVMRHLPMQHNEVVAHGLKELWRELELDGEPLLFIMPNYAQFHPEHHPLLLNQLLAKGQRRKQPRFGQLASWKRLAAPRAALGIASIDLYTELAKSNMQYHASPGDRGTVPVGVYGWLCYTFANGWTGLSTHFYDPEESDTRTIVALPPGRQDEWMAFLKLVDDLRLEIARHERRGRIEIIGGDDELAEAIKKTTFEDVILPVETLELVKGQQHIFDKQILSRYASLRVPRLRKVLLIGPPGTGKTTLLKATGSLHAKQGGLVFYVCAPPESYHTTSWQQLASALRWAAESKLPTMILVEDFELFVSDQQEVQLVLNTLDGVATPDNPAGTLLLATSNDPEKIDPRIRDRPGRVDVLIEIGLVEEPEQATRFLKHFLGAAYREEEHAQVVPQLLKQPGSHFRETCLAGAMHALEQGRTEVLQTDLLWAHETILNGRALAAQSERFLPAPARKRGIFFGKNT